jgi:penicillin-binding protein 1A
MFALLRYTLIIGIVLFSLSVAGVITMYFFLAPELPDAEELKETQLQVPLRIYSAEQQLIAEFGDKRRVPVQYHEIPEPLIQAILAAEDDRFFEHPGVDYHGLLRAAYLLATTGAKAQGGSTITMQVARNFFLSNEKTFLRKFNEIILSFQIEQKLSKEEILALYLNKIYLGKRAYGVGAAAVVYYGKPLSELNLPQLAMIAGLPKAPSKFNPVANPERAQLRRDYVLRRMWEVGFISESDYREAITAPITASYHSREVEVYAPYVAEMVRTQLIEQYGDDAYNMGLNVYTTIKANHQAAANKSLQTALLDYDKRHGYRGANDSLKLSSDMAFEDYEQLLSSLEKIGPLTPAIVTSMTEDLATIYVKQFGSSQVSLESVSWARPQLSTNSRGKRPQKMNDVFTVGDIIHVVEDDNKQWQLAQKPEVQGALVALHPLNGAVTALNGGFEYFQSKFNRAINSKRQPGSGFKPFIYSAALEKGYTAATLVNDAPVVFDDPGLENTWRPENYSGKFFGPTRLRMALTKSRNLVSIRLLRDIGISYAVNYATKFGFDKTQMPANLSLALGSGQAAPWDMARAYASLANGGFRVEPFIIKRIEDSVGVILFEAQPLTVCETCSINTVSTSDSEFEQVDIDSLGFIPARRIITPQNAYIMRSMLSDVIRYGTGKQALKLGRNDLAGKTGTTNDQVDAWFNGFNSELVATAWVGFDSPQTLGRYETGGRAALPMWIDFMGEALKDLPDDTLQKPVDLITVKIDPETGLLADFNDANAITETFRTEYVPKQAAPKITSPDQNVIVNPEIDLF